MTKELDSMDKYFRQYIRSDIDALVSTRTGETKLGERISTPAEEKLETFLENTKTSLVLIGIAEDIGILANHGRAGSSNTWNIFLRSFLNMQSNKFTQPETIAVIGHFSFEDLYQEIIAKAGTADEKIAGYRTAVSLIDDIVAEMIHLIVTHKRIPIVVGGGHNNAYPLIRGTALASKSRKGINCINLDAHLDFRAAEGRHSGNGFRYAKDEGFLDRYYVIGVHQDYLSDSIVKEIDQRTDIDFVTYEEIFVRKKKKWRTVLNSAVEYSGEKLTGIELDLDSLSDVASSASTPCGITSREALQFLDHVAVNCNVGYLHICEGIASSENNVGKLIAYLVSQFARSFRK